MDAVPVPIRNAMTVDLEDYFQVSAFEEQISQDDWDKLPSRIEHNSDRILELFASRDVLATFFILGWIAERFPGLVRKIADAGHEIGSHGYAHVRATNQTPEEFERDAGRTKRILEDVSGQEVKGFRAASFSITADTLWALDKLSEVGYLYSSSIYPVRHDLYGIPDAPRFRFKNGHNGIVEIPITTVQMMNRNFPCGGGGFFRLFPYALSRWALRRVNRVDRMSAVFYFHPWELDPGQPRPRGIKLKSRFRHYLNLRRMEGRLTRLLTDFRWGRMDETFLNGDAVYEERIWGNSPSL